MGCNQSKKQRLSHEPPQQPKLHEPPQPLEPHRSPQPHESPLPFKQTQPSQPSYDQPMPMRTQMQTGLVGIDFSKEHQESTQMKLIHTRISGILNE